MIVQYLNVDCILRSNDDLSSLVTFLKDNVFMLWDEMSEKGSFIGFETKLVNTNVPQEDITEFFRLFDSLPSTLTESLNQCYERVFDIGFASGDMGNPLNVRLDPEILSEIYKLGFSINIRVYPVADQNA